ncbi:ACT domain-containing protein [Pseudomonas aeruginosa]
MTPAPAAQVKNLKNAAASNAAVALANTTGFSSRCIHYNVKVLRTICPDQKGLIARITNICYKHELHIVQNNEFVDHRTGRFFMRTELEGIFNDAILLADLDSALPEGSIRELNPARPSPGGHSGDQRGALSRRSADESQLRRTGCRYRRGYRQP